LTRPLVAGFEVSTEVQQERASAAEEYVVTFERERLRAAGQTLLADEVLRVSLVDAGAGYDVRSFGIDGTPRLVEVKASAGPRDAFYMSLNELEVARREGARYWLAWIGWSYRLPAGTCEIAWFRNPASIIAAKTAWKLEAANFRIVRERTDSDLTSVP